MRSLGSRADGERLERMKASATWADERFHNVYPILPGLRDPAATMSSTDPVWGREHHRGDLRVRNASSRFRSRFDRCRTLTSSYLLHVDRL